MIKKARNTIACEGESVTFSSSSTTAMSPELFRYRFARATCARNSGKEERSRAVFGRLKVSSRLSEKEIAK